MYIRMYIRPSVPPPLGHPARPEAQPARPEAQSAMPEAQPGRYETQPASQASSFRHGWMGLGPGWLCLRPGWMAQRGERTDRQTENLPILQEFVPYRDRWPASPHEYQGVSRAGQGNR